MTEKPASNVRRSIAWSTLVVMAASAFSAVIGFGREIVTAHLFGTSSELDAFLNASTIPIVIFGIFNGALVAALVPIFSDYLASEKFDDARTLGSSIINGVFILLTVMAVIGWFVAPLLVPITAHGFPPQEQSLEIGMVRWLMPGIIALTISGVCTGLLNANHRFLASALVWAVANVITVAFTLLFHKQLGIYALVFGTTLGLFSQVLIQMPSIIKAGFYGMVLDVRHPGVARIWPLLIPVAVGSGATQINIAFDRYFASTLSSGSTSALNYTTKLSYLPIQVVAIAIGTVIFPSIARFFSSGNNDGARRDIGNALRMVTFIVVPSAVGLSTLSFPIVQALFQRGAFSPSATALCASLVPFACVPLVATSYSTVLSRACYACKEVRLAVGGSISAVIINIILSAAFLNILGARGLLLANGIAGIYLSAFLLTVLWRLIGGFEWKPLAWAGFRISISSAVMAAALRLCKTFGLFSADEFWSRVVHLAILFTIAAIVYGGTAWLLRVDELGAIARTMSRRLPFTQLRPPAELDSQS